MIEELFEHYKRLTDGDVGAASTLVLAHVQSGRQQMDTELLTIAEAAEILRVDRNTVSSLCQSGDLLSFKIGRNFRIRRDSIDEYTRQGMKSKGGKIDQHRKRLKAS